jgi:Nucleotidyltransferase domain
MAPSSVTWSEREGRALWDGETLMHWSDVIASELVELFDPVEVWLFGSVARGDDTIDSDLDLLVVLDDYDPVDVIGLKHRALTAVTSPAPFDVTFSSVRRMLERSCTAGTIERAVCLDGMVKFRRG